MEADEGDNQVMSVAVNKRMLLAQQTDNHHQEEAELKDEIKSCTPPSQRKSKRIPSLSAVSKRISCVNVTNRTR